MDRFERRSLSRVLTVLAALCLLSVAVLDRPVATWAHGLHRPAWCVWLTWLADVPGPASVLGLAVAGLAALSGRAPGPRAASLLRVCVSTLVAIAAVSLLKIAFGRTWPETWVGNNPSWIGTHTYGFFPFHGGAGWASFPSGHTTTITAPAASLWPSHTRWRPALLALPCLVAVGLVGADFHFLGDCLAGAALGIASSGCVGLAAGPMDAPARR